MRSAPSVNHIRRIATVAVLAAIVAPAVFDRPSFPLSTYPIYAQARQRTLTVHVVSIVGKDGSRRPAGLEAIARTDDPLIAQSTIDRAVGSGSVDRLCASIAARIEPGTPGLTVEISTERLDLVDRLQDEVAPQDRNLVARCEVSP